MDRRRKLELFEEIRREHPHGAVSIRAVAKKLGVHRRMVRQALASAIPPERKPAVRKKPRLGPVLEFIRGKKGQPNSSTRIVLGGCLGLSIVPTSPHRGARPWVLCKGGCDAAGIIGSSGLAEILCARSEGVEREFGESRHL